MGTWQRCFQKKIASVGRMILRICHKSRLFSCECGVALWFCWQQQGYIYHLAVILCVDYNVRNFGHYRYIYISPTYIWPSSCVGREYNVRIWPQKKDLSMSWLIYCECGQDHVRIMALNFSIGIYLISTTLVKGSYIYHLAGLLGVWRVS